MERRGYGGGGGLGGGSGFGGFGGGGGDWGKGGGKGNNDGWDFNTLFSMKDISPETKKHLTRVYTTLLTSVGACATGMYLNSAIMLTGFMMTIIFFGVMCYGIYQV